MKLRAPVSSGFHSRVLHTASWQQVCETRWCFLEVRGSSVLHRLQTPVELSHPLSPPSSCSLMSCGWPGLIVSLSRQTLENCRDFPTIIPLLKPLTSSFGDRDLSTNQSSKVMKMLSETKTSLCNKCQEEAFIWKLCVIYIRKYKIQDLSLNEFYYVKMFCRSIVSVGLFQISFNFIKEHAVYKYTNWISNGAIMRPNNFHTNVNPNL